MKSNNECKIVEDLLPNYIDNLTSETTNEFIEAHIKSTLALLLGNNVTLHLFNLPLERTLAYISLSNSSTNKLTSFATSVSLNKLSFGPNITLLSC